MNALDPGCVPVRGSHCSYMLPRIHVTAELHGIFSAFSFHEDYDIFPAIQAKLPIRSLVSYKYYNGLCESLGLRKCVIAI